ncbi:uncharacterized protein EDB91DRAFT_1327918 [Suillus paluster]|uniref:uncharacterized protein n=1 Tax=Suillus paluster TaxID=48578 RepID=UPI001B8693EA|nr:uncharacterized protein EDB91DRAFT_1327918 [Suillus paluster]KAG1746559.1 Pleckstrin homology domain-containing protein [Suillus paluster]
MKSPSPSARSPRNHQFGHPTLDHHHSHLSPASYQLPPISPKPSTTKTSAFKGLQSVFQRKLPDRSLSSNSLRSSYSASNASATDNNHSPHPYAVMPPPVPVVSSNEHIDDEQECPVCLEPLSFSFRLPGEKPHVVPECGHSLHEACFTAVYGPPPAQSRSTVPRKSNLGVCGVCRRPMKIGDGDSSKTNKLAALTGMGDPHSAGVYPGRDISGSRTRRSPVPHQHYDPTDDDPIDHAVSVKSTPSESHYIVAPSIQVRPEFSSITRNGDACQPLTCIVVIELPARRGSTHVPGPVMSDTYGARSAHGHSRTDTEEMPHPSQRQNDVLRRPSQAQRYDSCPEAWSPNTEAESSRYAPGTPPEEESPFNAIVEDLRNRIIDWKGHALSGLGPLQMYDMLSVRRDALVREFFVYLFKEAIICVVEEKKRSLGRFLSSPAFNDASTSVSGSSSQSNKGVLRLKGRIYVRHIKRITASTSGEMSLTIEMEDERLDSFILVFKDRSAMDAWKSQIQGLVTSFQHQASPPQPPIDRGLDMDEFGGSAKAARMLSGCTTSTSPSTVDSLLQGSSRSTMSSSTSQASSMPQPRQMHSKLQPLGEDDVLSHYDTHPSGLVAPHVSAGPSNSLAPLPHPPLDLILIVSLPPPNAPRSTAALKLRVIKASLDFTLASLGAKDRLSLVTFEVGPGGRVRKTPYLCVGKAHSRGRLSKFIDEIGRSDEGQDDEFLVRASKEEKTDVVTAVNHGLDVVLQRKSRNPISGMILVSDAADSTRRAQMDLVLARAEAGNMPIHSFGYGRSHDPASLWLMSNHTSGTYTFVKDWYDLRDCLAGCVGGMMSIGLLNMKLHMKIVDGQRFRIRKVSGGPSSILSTDGHNVDIDVGELRYGECKEMLIECELDNTETRRPSAQNGNRALNATDQFVQSMGLDSLAIDDGADLVDGMMDRMIDEVPVLEVDGSFYDPSAAKQVSRLAHPVLLTITLLPQITHASPKPVKPSDPVIVRRRMELLASDMITRALVLVSRKNYPQAQKIMNETKRILHTVLQSISKTLPPPNTEGTTMRNRKDILTLAAVRAMQAILQDLQLLAEALEENVELFAHDQRNFGAQQAMILRDQKSWSGRSATERLFWTMDNSIELVSRSTDWVARD